MDELVRGEPTPPGGGRGSSLAGLREALAEYLKKTDEPRFENVNGVMEF